MRDCGDLSPLPFGHPGTSSGATETFFVVVAAAAKRKHEMKKTFAIVTTLLFAASFAPLFVWGAPAVKDGPCLTRSCGVASAVGVPNNDTYTNDAATKSLVRIHIPFELDKDEGEEHVKADYGYTTKAGSIAAFVYYVEKSLCSRMIFNRTAPEEAGWPVHDGGRKSPYILMAPFDFNCHSVLQVRNAQMEGAAALVLADPNCRCTDTNCTKAFGPDCYKDDITLTTDGSSSDVSIPSVMLYKPKAQAILNQVKKGQPVLMEITWGLAHHEHKKKVVGPVHAALWTTAHDPIAELDTLEEFAALSKHFAADAVVAPRYSLIDGARFHCDKQVQEGGPCDHLCTNKGKYCALHAQNGIQGHDVVRETLRRLCIWKHYGDWRDPAVEATEEQAKKMGASTTAAYWDYVLYHRENCYSVENFVKEECIKQAYQAAKVIDESKINTCMSNSGDLDTSDSNTILDAALHAQKHDGVVSIPSIVVDRKTLDSHSSYDLFYAICDPFFEFAQLQGVPDLCNHCWDCSNVIGCVTSGGKCEHEDYSKEHNKKKEATGGSKKKKNHPFLRFIGWILFLSVVGFGGYHLYQTRFRNADGRGYGGGGGGGGFYTQLVGGSE